MREVKFRGKSPEGEWIYGSYINRSQADYMYDVIIDNKNRKKAVIPETVGQLVKIENGVEFYIGDLVAKDNGESIGIIKKNKDELGFYIQKVSGKEEFYMPGGHEFFDWYLLDKRGNKFDNSELIEPMKNN